MNSDELVQYYVDAYGKDRARSMIRLYSFARHGLKVIDTKRLSIWNSLADMDTSNQINWKNVNKILDKDLSRKRRRTYIKKSDKQKQDDALGDIGTPPAKSDEELTKEEREFKQELEESYQEVESNRQTSKEFKKDLAEPDKTEDSLAGASYEVDDDPNNMSYGYPDDSNVEDYSKSQV